MHSTHFRATQSYLKSIVTAAASAADADVTTSYMLKEGGRSCCLTSMTLGNDMNNKGTGLTHPPGTRQQPDNGTEIILIRS